MFHQISPEYQRQEGISLFFNLFQEKNKPHETKILTSDNNSLHCAYSVVIDLFLLLSSGNLRILGS